MARTRNESVELSAILLDNDNPRHTTIASEPEIIAHLLKSEFVKPLARSITELGTTSPLERLALMPHPRVKGSYVSLEGNRRVCALKLLADPDKAPTEPDRRYFRSLRAKLAEPIDRCDAVIFANRRDARPWLSLRHEGAMSGEGTRTWNSRQKERFARGSGSKGGNVDTQASLLLDYALERSLVTRDEHDKINLTTLTRFLKSPVFRNAMGLATARDLTVVVPQSEFDEVAKRFLRDAKSGVTVHSRTRKADWEAYAHQLRTEKVAPTTRVSEPYNLDPRAPRSAEARTRKSDRASKHPDKRRTVIPSDFTAPVKERLLRRIYEELRSLDAQTYSFAAAYLLRAFIERTAVLFAKEFKLGHEGELHAVLGRCARKLEAEGLSDNDLKPIRLMASDRDSRISPHTLGAWLHGSAIPTSAELARFWETVESNLKAMLTRLKQ